MTAQIVNISTTGLLIESSNGKRFGLRNTPEGFIEMRVPEGLSLIPSTSVGAWTPADFIDRATTIIAPGAAGIAALWVALLIEAGETHA